MVRPPGAPLDEEIEDRFRGPLGLGAAYPPARKMTVDVHPGKAIDQRPAGDLHLLEVGRAELARRKRVRQRALGQFDQLGIVMRDAGGVVVVEEPATGDDLEMGRIAHRPAQIGQPQAAEARQRVIRRRRVKRDGYLGWERQYLPAYSMGILVVSTSKGLMSHHEARVEGIGGVLVGYVF